MFSQKGPVRKIVLSPKLVTHASPDLNRITVVKNLTIGNTSYRSNFVALACAFIFTEKTYQTLNSWKSLANTHFL